MAEEEKDLVVHQSQNHYDPPVNVSAEKGKCTSHTYKARYLQCRQGSICAIVDISLGIWCIILVTHVQKAWIQASLSTYKDYWGDQVNGEPVF